MDGDDHPLVGGQFTSRVNSPCFTLPRQFFVDGLLLSPYLPVHAYVPNKLGCCQQPMSLLTANERTERLLNGHGKS